MTTLQKDDSKNLVLKIEDLQTLVSAGFPNASDAMRKLDDDNVESLIASDSTKWPPIEVTATDKGYVVIDGYHRVKAANEKGENTIRAISRSYADINAVLEAAFTANLSHGLTSDKETRSRYVRWLHTTYPELTQEQLAARAQVNQSTVSRALRAKDKAELDQADTTDEDVEESEEDITSIDELNKAFKKFIKAVHTFEDVSADIETDVEVIRILASQAKKDEDKQALEAIGNLMLKAAKHVATPKKATKKTATKVEATDGTAEKKPAKKQAVTYAKPELPA